MRRAEEARERPAAAYLVQDRERGVAAVLSLAEAARVAGLDAGDILVGLEEDLVETDRFTISEIIWPTVDRR